MNATATTYPTPTRATPERERFPSLVAEVATWDLLQETRIKMQLPILMHLRRAGVIEKAEKIATKDLLALCIGSGAPPQFGEILVSISAAEVDAEKRILREWRKHPLAAWAKDVHGVGEHSCAVLVAYLDGDPYVAHPKIRVGERGSSQIFDAEPFVRTVGQLWAYCGVGRPDLKRVRGMSQDDALAAGKPKLKARVRLISESMLKTGNRALYDEARERYSERAHDAKCAQCAATAGDPWRDGHKHAAALRFVGKRFLRDLWEASRDAG